MFPGMVSFRRKRCTEPVPPVPAADTAKTPVQQKETAGDAGGSDDADGDGDLGGGGGGGDADVADFTAAAAKLKA